MRLIVEVLLKLERAGALAASRRRRIVAQLRVMHREVDPIEAKSVDSAVEPEARHVEYGVLDRSIVQVEVRLLRQEIVQIILASSAVPGPRRPAEHRLPVVGR